jgi:hypothetical protein
MPSVRHLGCAVLALAAASSVAVAEPRRPAVELGGGIDFTMLGSFDVGKSLGGMAERSDLGPGTLGVFVILDLPVSDQAIIGAEAGIAVGGLVKTDERYFGMRASVGSTLTVWLRAKAGWSVGSSSGPRARVGAAVGVERLSEATGLGSVRLDALVAGPWLALPLGRGITAELHADIHIPYRGNIGDDMRGDPSGTFLGGGARINYVFGLGRR